MSTSSAALRIDGELTIYRAQELMRPLVDAAAHATPGGIDLRGVTEIDTAGVQLLLLAARAARAAGGPLRITGCSDVVAEALALLGIELPAGEVAR
jgi:anti-anti-sigma factor